MNPNINSSHKRSLAVENGGRFRGQFWDVVRQKSFLSVAFQDFFCKEVMIMKELVTAEQMRRSDAFAIEHQHMASPVLMERAALAVADEILQHQNPDKILAVCGTGNNGGDGAAAARILRLRGYDAEICPVGNPEKYSEGMRTQMKIAGNYRIPVVNNPVFTEYTVIIDALFGTGLSRAVTGAYAKVIDQINESHVPVVSVDIPSGIHTDTGAVLGTAVHAAATVTFAFEKPGLLLPPGSVCSGTVYQAEIGVSGCFLPGEPRYYRMEQKDLLPFLKRNPLGNKGTFGKILAVAGSREICGAALLCSEAAFRAGAGMVRVLTEENNRLPFLLKLPEAMLSLYRDGEPLPEETLTGALEWSDLALIGPGLGTGDTARELVKWLLSGSSIPVVIDADALNLIAREPSLLKKASCPTVVTPHLGEMARLTGKSIPALKQNLPAAALDFAKEFHTVCVLKDARTVVASPEGTLFINSSGCSALATAGSGDVLTGILASLLVQQKNAGSSLPAECVAAAAVFLHGLLGEQATGQMSEASVLAGDLIRMLEHTDPLA